MAIPRFRSMLRWIKWDKSKCAVAAMGTACIVFFLSLFLDSTSNSRLSVDSLFNSSSNSDLVKLTLSSKAEERGAFCLDGSLPGYHFQKGFGSGSDKWVLHIEGGGWCNTVESCKSRAMTKLGSSKYFEQEVPFGGILSRDPSQNPDFYNWNRVKIRYCDGASFAGHPEAELKNETRLFFRGQLIWEAIMDDLLSRGMSGAKQAFLTGCSAGGLATLIHCDYFKDHLPKDVTVKCLADAGFFLDELDIRKNPTMKSFYHDVVHLQSVTKSLEKNCVAKTEPSNCMFPKEFIKNIKTPVFIVNPAYDFWQIQNILVPFTADPNRDWGRCRLNIKDCDATQIEILHGNDSSFLLYDKNPSRSRSQKLAYEVKVSVVLQGIKSHSLWGPFWPNPGRSGQSGLPGLTQIGSTRTTRILWNMGYPKNPYGFKFRNPFGFGLNLSNPNNPI